MTQIQLERSWISNNENNRERERAYLPLDVVVKEIYIQTCLNTTANINDPVVFVVQLVIGSVHPVHYVQSPIGA